MALKLIATAVRDCTTKEKHNNENNNNEELDQTDLLSSPATINGYHSDSKLVEVCEIDQESNNTTSCKFKNKKNLKRLQNKPVLSSSNKYFIS